MTTKNFTKRDEINARNSLALQDLEDGTIITATKAGLIQRPDAETGEVKTVSVIITEDGTAYSAISATVCDIMGDIIELMDDENASLELRLNKRKSKAGREFLSLTVL